MTISREWFTTYCQNAAANVLDRDNAVRFNYSELKAALDTVTRHEAAGIPSDVLKLHNNIVALCNRKYDVNIVSPECSALMLTLLNIHAAYLMVSGLWKEEPPVQTGGTDEYGFEIF